jgi:hypothetical protein
MVGAEHKRVVVWSAPIQSRTKEVALLQQEGVTYRGLERRGEALRLAGWLQGGDVDPLQCEVLGCDDEQVLPVGRKRRTKGVMAGQQSPQRTLQCFLIEHALQLQGTCLVVRQGGLRAQPIREPHFALRLGRGDDRDNFAQCKRVRLSQA